MTRIGIYLDDAAEAHFARAADFYGPASSVSSVVRSALALLDRHLDDVEADPSRAIVERARFVAFMKRPPQGTRRIVESHR